jgi:glucosamine--fructose-6-phosphate aminotransferase (isomerizing)
MWAEAGEAPERVRAQLHEDAALIEELAARLRDFRPRALVTCARGSSDHASTYARYLVETRMGMLTASASPSVSSIYGVTQDFSQCLFLAISQSGSSPDLLATAAAAKAAGALVVALVNAENSPLAALADYWLPMRAGKESSVAATKSYLCSLSAIAHLVSRWADDRPLGEALIEAPDLLAQAWRLDWDRLVEALIPAQHLFVLARGLGLGAAQEAALKLKETCSLHAEAFSSAEVQHGPMALFTQGVPVLMFCQSDATRAGMEALAGELSGDGVRTLIAGGVLRQADELPTVAAHPAIEPMLLTQTFYGAAATLAIARGLDPDRPPRLKKVTRTC